MPCIFDDAKAEAKQIKIDNRLPKERALIERVISYQLFVNGYPRRSLGEWSEWDERHGRQSREGSGRAQRELPRYKAG